MRRFDSDLHAMVAGGLTAVLDFSRLASALGISIEVEPMADGEGNYLPEWNIKLRNNAGQGLDFRLALEQLGERNEANVREGASSGQ